jgi:flavin-binding protein dodecin
MVRNPIYLSGKLDRSLNKRTITMSVARTTEVTASSGKGFEDAIEKGIKRFSKTIDNVEGAWIKEQKVIVKDGEVSEYRVTMKVSFLLKG